MKILGIETSCDETGVAIYDSKSNSILAEQLYSQADIHAIFGGVVPELASRDHILKLLPLVSKTFEESGINPKNIDGIAYTAGPGLRGPLLVGATLARSLALGWSKPCVGVHHMEAHLLVNLLENPSPSFPFLTLLISGGHCMLVHALGLKKYKVLGQSRDDAVGEAFDKVAKLLCLSYPGGPKLEKVAEYGDPNSFDLPRPMIKANHLDFSFSGLKTAVFYEVKKQKELSELFISNIAASFQEAIADTLIFKCKKALYENNLNLLVIGGGVASNKYLRKRIKQDLDGVKIFFPDKSRCTDNGAMVAYTGYFHLKKGVLKDEPIIIKPRWDLSELV